MTKIYPYKKEDKDGNVFTHISPTLSFIAVGDESEKLLASRAETKAKFEADMAGAK